MTPSAPASAPIPASPAPAQKSSREAATKDNARPKATEVDNSLTENKEATEKTSATVFEELMAALLTMQPASPAKEQGPTIDIKPPANDETLPAPYNPPLLVMPQPQQDVPPPVNVSGEFCPEFISALTPGLPAPPTDTTAATVTAPVPVVANEGSPALKAFNDTPADPRVIAAGLTPQEMEAFKEQLVAAQKQAQAGAQQPQPMPASDTQTSGSAPQAQTTQPVTTNTQMTPPVQPLKVITVNLLPGAEPAPPAVVTAQAADVAAPSEPLLEKNAPAFVETEGKTEDFDPVEFRIAQKYHRATPASSPAASSQFSEVKTTPVVNSETHTGAKTLPAVSTDQAVKGKVDTQANFDFSLLSSTAAFGTAASDGLSTAAPSALPLSVTTLTSPVTQNISAAQSHPAVQTVAAIINKAAKGNTSQTISLRLDPPDLGKLEVQMKYKKGDPLKVHVVLEKADTAAMFQRDAHALEAALKEAGVQADSSSLSFEMAKDGNSFQGQMNQGDNRNSSPVAAKSELPQSPVIETSMDIATDSRTGLTHYNIRA